MARSSTFPVLLLVLVGCSSETTSADSSASPKGSTAAAQPSGSAKPAASASASPSTSAKAAGKPAPPKKADKDAAVKHLAAGRKLAAKKDWKGAITEYEAALTTSPTDSRVLGELGWAAFQAGDLAKAKDANKKALAAVHAPSQRASILYNIGRVAEEEKDTAAAKAAYAESLSLRENKEVAKHFEAVGGKPGEIASAFSICTDGYDSLKDLCACLVKKAPDFMILPEAPKCEADPSPPSLGDARFSLLHMRGDEGREDTHVLASKDGKKYRAVAVLGTSYEPGAFGVHNEHTVTGAEAKKVGAKSIVVIRHHEDDNDSNMAGLEHCFNDVQHETLCILGEGDAATRCPTTVPVSARSGCELGIEPDETASDEEKELAKNVKASAKVTEAKTSYTIGEDGKLTIKLESGDAASLPPNTVGERVLFTK